GGVEVRWASVRYQLTHAKMMIVDKKQALVGSINFSKAAQNKNREVDVLLAGPALEQLVQTFEQDWADGSLVRAG
ncbi:MAG: phospholipase D-like domain-containing protein, partial [Candidatus Marsarchaeota archaeon]|nr:phospholipase D-like domain-containing protein [Candidatus Marsarchaeota archaeon]